MRPLALLTAGFLLSIVIFTGVSCQKETDCKAVVTCIDSLARPLSEADVLLYALVKSPDGKTTYTADVKAEGVTGGDGTVNFTFKLPAIYDIKATSATDTRTITGIGIIKLEEGKTVEKTVILK